MISGIMGGTFDPIHLGHIALARAAMRELALESVLFLPSGDPPHKAPTTPKGDRCEMTRLAIADEPGFELCALEIERIGRTYTVDTLEELTASRPSDGFVYIVGSDTLFQLHTWRAPSRVARLCSFAVVTRPGDDEADIEAARRRCLSDFGLKTVLLRFHGLDVSSQAVREACARGKSISGSVPPAVAAYIHERGLYKTRQ